MSSKKGKIILLIINLYIAISSIVIAVIGVSKGAGEGQLGASSMYGWRYLKAFTNDSNILSGISSLILSIFIIKSIRKEDDSIPYWCKVLIFTSTVAVSLTFLTVIFFLGPMQVPKKGISGFLWFYKDDMFFFHLINPVLAILNFFLLKTGRKYTFRENLLAIIPMALYSIFYVIGILTNFMSDFYGFTFGGHYALIPLVMIIMYAFTYLIGFVLRIIKNKIESK